MVTRLVIAKTVLARLEIDIGWWGLGRVWCQRRGYDGLTITSCYRMKDPDATFCVGDRAGQRSHHRVPNDHGYDES